MLTANIVGMPCAPLARIGIVTNYYYILIVWFGVLKWLFYLHLLIGFIFQFVIILGRMK